MNDTPTTRDEVQAARDAAEAELARLNEALDAMPPEHVGDVKNASAPDLGVADTGLGNAEPESGAESEPEPGQPASAEQIAAARSAPPVTAQAPEAPDGAPEPDDGADDDTGGADGPSEPPPGSPAEPADIAAARMAPPAPVVVPPSE